jgi:hypothetical protein
MRGRECELAAGLRGRGLGPKGARTENDYSLK